MASFVVTAPTGAASFVLYLYMWVKGQLLGRNAWLFQTIAAEEAVRKMVLLHYLENIERLFMM